MNKLQPLRGMKDLLPENFRIHEYIISVAKNIGQLYGYSPMSTPIVEYSKVFDRTLGDTSDIINKEIYSFHDKSGDSIALRPEFTAGVMRSFISHGELAHNLPLKFFSYGPVFRYDRPQAGRQREFNQLNFEYIGAKGPHSDAETIKLAIDILSTLEIINNVTLEINSLGCAESRVMYQAQLVEYFNANKESLSEDSIKRLAKNPMRILDSKDEKDKLLVQSAPIITDYYTDFSRQYFEDLLHYLDLLNINYVINNRLVRGLDYYCHTAFEFTTNSLGAQSTIIAGGRYDGLAKMMNGPDTPAIGFAGGIERIALMREYSIIKVRYCVVLPIEEKNITASLILTDNLRKNNIKVLLETQGKITKRLQRALVNNVKYVIFVGDAEQDSNMFKLKDLDTAHETQLQFEKIIEILRQNQQ